MKIFIKAILGVAAWIGFFYFYAVKLSGTNAGVNMLVFFSSLFVFIAYLLWITGVPGMWITEIRSRRLLTEGHPAIAVIISARQTGVKVSANANFPKYGTSILLEIETTGGEKFRAETIMMLAEHEIAALSEGKKVKVHYHPVKKNRVVIDSLWSN